MAKKIIYFVRHGETLLNARGIRQGKEGPLSELGREQVRATTKRFPAKRGRAEVIISSPYERAQETASILTEKLKLPIEYSDLLVERRNPSEIVGHSKDEERVKKIVDRIDLSFHADNLRYSDEENFADLKARAEKLLSYITTRKEERIIMVTHSIFLKMVAAYMLHGDNLTASDYNKLSFYNPIDNAGIAIAVYKTHWFKAPTWELLVWNDLM